MNILESMDGKPMKQVCIRMNGQMIFISPPFPMYSCGDLPISIQLSVFLHSSMDDARNTECCMLTAFPYLSPVFHNQQFRYWEMSARSGYQEREPSMIVCPKDLSGRCMLRFLPATPLPYYSLRLAECGTATKGQFQWRNCRLWKAWGKAKRIFRIVK